MAVDTPTIPATIVGLCRCSYKLSVTAVRLERKFSDFENFNESSKGYFMKIRSVAVELFHTERRTDRHDDADMRSFQRVEDWLNVTMEDICVTGNDIPQTENVIQ